MDSIVKQLVAMEAQLKAWLTPGPEGTFVEQIRKQGGEPEAGQAAGKLVSIEMAARYLREQMGIPITVVASVKITGAQIGTENVPMGDDAPLDSQEQPTAES